MTRTPMTEKGAHSMLRELEYIFRRGNREELQEKGIVFLLLASSFVVYFFAVAAVAAGN